MSVSYLPHVQPPNNNTAQVRRRVNDIVSTVTNQVGSISTNSGDLGNLNSKVGSINSTLSGGVTGTIILAKLTTGGTTGSINVVGGVIKGFVNPT